MKLTFTGIIPARLQSTRLPGKPLVDINGKPMIWHVYQAAKKWKHFKNVYVATGDQEIVDICTTLNIPCIITVREHSDCLDRCAEVVEILTTTKHATDRYVIIQGDEPMFNSKLLDIDEELYQETCINFYKHVKGVADKEDINIPKVIMDKTGKAIYFSRASIPNYHLNTARTNQHPQIFKQIGVYVFQGDILILFSQFPKSVLEESEGIGLNRFIYHGRPIHMVETSYDSYGVDTPDDLKRVTLMMEQGI